MAKLTITDADREAAAELFSSTYDDGSLGFIMDEYRAGIHDDDEIVTAFARHRQQALEQAADFLLSESEERLKDGCERDAEVMAECAAAIRALGEG